jgi:iron complex transport system ATP-binding protein
MMRTHKLDLHVGARTLVQALDWQISAGECWCVIGRNGAGKTTLMRTLAGLREADGGAVDINGRALAQWPLPALAQERAYLPQARVDAFGYRAIDTVLAARHPYQHGDYWESEADLQAAQAALAALDVAALAQRDVRTLSGGERQRVAIAAVLAQETPLLLLDEPANALDLAHQVSLMHLLARLCRSAGKSVVMVSHDLNLARDTASHALLLMGDGSWQAGPVAEVMRADILSACLGHPIEVVQHAGHSLYIPARPMPALAPRG